LESIRVLVIEDNPNDFALIERVLDRLEGFDAQVTLASNLTAARAIAKTNEFDTALVDLFVRNECGLDVVPQLLSRGRSCAPILLTGDLTPKVQRNAMNAGVFASLPKDKLDAPLLETVIRHALQNRHLLSRLLSCLDEVERARSERMTLAADFMGLLATALEPVVNGAAGIEHYVAGEQHSVHLVPQVQALSRISRDLKSYCRDTSTLLSRIDYDHDGGECLDLQSLLIDVVRVVGERKKDRNIDIGMAMLDHPVPVHGDETILLRALVDLVLACLSHVVPNGRLDIKVAMEEDEICLGIGSLQFCARPDALRLNGALRVARSRALFDRCHGSVQIVDTPDRRGYVVLVRLPRAHITNDAPSRAYVN
jgi:response regulator of citrate/malate metabolism